jgi:hypothetical protein
MNKIGLVIRELHRSENKLAADLLSMADRHKADHEIYHVARDLARWSREHVAQLAGAGNEYGVRLDPQARQGRGPLAAIEQKTSELIGRRPEPAMLLLADLRHLYRDASGVSLDWELLAQAAQVKKNHELLALAKRCHPETLRQARWANTKLKETSPQALAS